MDKKIIDKLFKLHIKNLTDTNFQLFINFLFKLIYGNDFKTIKQKKDKGIDGIIESKKLAIAIYGPELNETRKFIRKIKPDFDKYFKFWKNSLPNWLVIYNNEILAGQYDFVKTLYKKSELWGINEIISEISNLTNSKKLKIGEYLGIDREYMSRNIMKEIIDDLIVKQQKITKPEYKIALDIDKKIEINFGLHDVESVKKDFDICLEDFTSLNDILSGYENDDITKLKSNIISDFNFRHGSFKEKFYGIVDYYSRDYNNDDEYKYYIRVILYYLFEQCLIGKLTEVETN